MSDRLRDKAARLFAQGKSVSQVASEMGVTTKTAEKWERLARKRGTAYRAVRGGAAPKKVDKTGPTFKAKVYGKPSKPAAKKAASGKNDTYSREYAKATKEFRGMSEAEFDEEMEVYDPSLHGDFSDPAYGRHDVAEIAWQKAYAAEYKRRTGHSWW